MIRPDRFISVAEETGLIVPIGKWVIREACRQARELAEAGLGELQIAINLSPKQFTDLTWSARSRRSSTKRTSRPASWNWSSPKACCWTPPTIPASNSNA